MIHASMNLLTRKAVGPPPGWPGLRDQNLNQSRLRLDFVRLGSALVGYMAGGLGSLVGHEAGSLGALQVVRGGIWSQEGNPSPCVHFPWFPEVRRPGLHTSSFTNSRVALDQSF